MNYELTREAIYDTLASVQGVGTIFRHQRYSTDMATFLNRFASDHPEDPERKLINVAWITRQTSNESASGSFGSRAENLVVTTVGIQEDWFVTFILAHRDDDDSDLSSETIFQRVVDNIKAAFRWPDTWIPTHLITAEPAEVLDSKLYEIGDVLCHKAEIRIRVQHYITA